MTKHLSGKIQSHVRIKSVNKTPRHAVSAWRFPAISHKAAFNHGFNPQNNDTRDLKICYGTTKNSRGDCFLLFSGSSAAGKYQFDDMLPVIHAEFMSAKLAIDVSLII